MAELVLNLQMKQNLLRLAIKSMAYKMERIFLQGEARKPHPITDAHVEELQLQSSSPFCYYHQK